MYLSNTRLTTNNQILQTFSVQSLEEGSEQSVRGNPISNKWVPNQNLLSHVHLSVSVAALHLSSTTFSVGAIFLWTSEEIPVQPGAEEDSVLNHRHRTELHNFPPILRFHL